MKLKVVHEFQAFKYKLPYGSVVEGYIYYNEYFKENRMVFDFIPGHAFKLEYFTPVILRIVGV